MEKRITYRKILPLIAVLTMIFFSCEKEIAVEVPPTEQRIVVEGYIENEGIPVVTLTTTTDYFAETGTDDLFNAFVHDANVTVTVDGQTHQLTEVCASQIPDSLLPLFSELSGIVIEPGSAFDYCIYTDISFALRGETAKTYKLKVEAEDKILTATTTIPNIVSLDSTWFRVEGTLDSLGYVWAELTDPDTTGNAYRLFLRRINHYPDGQIKDPVFIPPFNSALDDRFFNGLTFTFNSQRGILPYSSKEDDTNEERGFFKVGDTIAVKGCSVDMATYRFFNSYYHELASQGSPFATPSSLETNIEGGLGIWSGYAVYRDTIIAR